MAENATTKEPSPHLSKSQFNRWVKCPAQELAIQTGRHPKQPTTLPMIIGAYVDRALTQPETLAEWVEKPENRDLLYGKAGKYADVKRADAVIERVREDAEVMCLLRNGTPQAFLEWRLGGSRWVGYLDGLHEMGGLFVELKVTGRPLAESWQSVNGKNMKVPWYAGYWPEMALYAEGCKQKFGRPFTGYLVCVTLETIPDIRIIAFEPGPGREAQLAQIEAQTPAICDYKDGTQAPPRCESCDWCKLTRGFVVEPAESWWLV